MGVGIVKHHNVRTVQKSSYIWVLVLFNTTTLEQFNNQVIYGDWYCLIPQRKTSSIIKLYMGVGIVHYHNVRTVQLSIYIWVLLLLNTIT
jgi:hypothetical protein